jgi:mono/diheme cytochrome c family protein
MVTPLVPGSFDCPALSYPDPMPDEDLMPLPSLPMLILSSAFAALLAPAVMAQDMVGDADKGRTIYQRVGICVNCHGWAGDGRAGANPLSHAAAANLRESGLDTAGLVEVIKCGIPGTAMPYHDSAAYSDGRCYGMVMGDYEPGSEPARGKTFRDKQLADLIAYLQTRMIGLGKPTYDECADYFGSSAGKACAYLKSD